MTAHIRLVSSEGGEPGLDGKGIESDAIPLGLPEEAAAIPYEHLGRDVRLGEAPPPLVAEGEGHPIRRRNPRGGLAALAAFVWPRKPKAAPVAAEKATGSERVDVQSDGDRVAAGETEAAEQSAVSATEDQAVVANEGEAIVAERRAPGALKAGFSLYRRKSALAAVLLTGVAASAIVFMNRPQAPPPQSVEPGMLAEGTQKLMAPSAALAKVPPREEPNVAGERPQRHETRGAAFQEMLSFKGGAAAPLSGPSAVARDASGTPLPARPLSPAPEAAQRGPAPVATVVVPVLPAASPAPGPKAVEVASLPPVASSDVPPPSAPPVAQASQEPGLGEAARIEGRLREIETRLQEREPAAPRRLEEEKATTRTADQIARLAALVTQLTGQVKDMQDQVRTLSSGSEEKFADLTRRVSIGESNRAVAAAEAAAAAPASAPAAGAKGSVEGEAKSARTQGAAAKAVADGEKRSGRRQS
jgi:hypothetical protein